jgi:hypothetical protein
MTGLYGVGALLACTLTVLDFHVHVDRPDVHTLGVVGDNSFEHSATTLRVGISEF